MTGSTIDHLVSVTLFLAALLLFISLFNQTIQTAILYQRHRSLATEASDLLDTMMLSTGIPTNWGTNNVIPSGFGLQDPEFTQYMLSSFSLMRLQSSLGQPVYYSKTGLYYSNITMGFGDLLLVPYTKAVDYSTAARLLGINGSYGFQLTIMPLITVSVSEIQAANSLKITVNVTGGGLPLANAAVSCSFLNVSLTGSFPSYKMYDNNSNHTDKTGSVLFTFPGNTITTPYSFIAYARFNGLVGVGYHQRASSQNQYIIPFLDDLTTGRVLLAHSYDVHNNGSPLSIAYNATFILLAQDFTLREMPLNATQKIGTVNYGPGNPYGVVTITPYNQTYNPGILMITYKVGTQGGVVLMPWGLSSMAFPVVFGGNPSGNEWVATDIRQVVVGDVAYQAKLGLWSLQGYEVKS